MKKILVVDCNAKLGGIQKALIAFLQHENVENEVSVLFLYKSGCLLKNIPANIKIYTTSSDYRYMGMSQADCTTITDKIKRGLYVVISKLFGQRTAVGIANLTMHDRLPDQYEEIISYSHMSSDRSFFGGTPQYVMKLPDSAKKICYIHCDYQHSGNRSSYSDKVYQKFDQIVCVSESTKNVFINALPQMKDKVIARYNYINGDEIRSLAWTNPFIYERQYINAVIVARMTKEKGIERIIRILGDLEQGHNLRVYIIGDGIERNNISDLIDENGCQNMIFLLGEQDNPYRYMTNADIIIVPSYHEAAPVVFQEAIELGVPVLTTRTTSADEMIGNRHGTVVDNNDEALKEGIIKIIKEPHVFISRFQQQ